MDTSIFYTERWCELFDEWIPALRCHFDSLKSAQQGLDYFSTMSQQQPIQSTIMHSYKPKEI